METEETKKIISKLDQEIISTKNKIQEYKKLTKPIAPENAIGRVSRMDAINNKSVVEAALRNLENKIEDLLIVKKDINKEDFGKCIRCKSNIPIERIMFLPSSRKCVRCAS